VGLVGCELGWDDGFELGCIVGRPVGLVGWEEGWELGCIVGCPVGFVGWEEGCDDGMPVGETDARVVDPSRCTYSKEKIQ
jgi:precorrin isomerase